MLKAESVSYQLNNRKVVRNVNFSTRNGELMAIVGANGAGKSTLINLLNGTIKPSEGRVILDGRNISSYKTHQLASKRATLSQHNPVNLDFSVVEIVLMGRYPYFSVKPSAPDTHAVDEAMEICGITDLAHRPYLQLSGGEQQRVQLARVLSQLWDQPGSLLLLDEPVSGLDLLYQHQTLSIVKAMVREGFKAVAVLHDLNLAAQYADRILMMKNGRRWKEGTPAEVFNPIDIYTVFGIEAEIMMNPKTLTPYILPKEIKHQLSGFNSAFSDMPSPENAVSTVTEEKTM